MLTQRPAITLYVSLGFLDGFCKPVAALARYYDLFLPSTRSFNWYLWHTKKKLVRIASLLYRGSNEKS